MKGVFLCRIMLLCIFQIGSPALGWTRDASHLGHEVPKWELGIGISAASSNIYPGAREIYTAVVPFPYFVYRGEILEINREAVTGILLDSNRVDLDLSVSGTLPVISKRTSARKNMPDLPPTLAIGPEFKLRLFGTLTSGILSTHLPLEANVTGPGRNHHISYQGLSTTPHLRFQYHSYTAADEYWDYQLTVGVLIADKRFQNYVYGVSEKYATPERPAYSAPAGQAGWRISTGASKRTGDLWYGGFIRYIRIQEAAIRSSPLVQQNQGLIIGVAVAWVMQRSAELVPDRLP